MGGTKTAKKNRTKKCFNEKDSKLEQCETGIRDIETNTNNSCENSKENHPCDDEEHHYSKLSLESEEKYDGIEDKDEYLDLVQWVSIMRSCTWWRFF